MSTLEDKIAANAPTTFGQPKPSLGTLGDAKPEGSQTAALSRPGLSTSPSVTADALGLAAQQGRDSAKQGADKAAAEGQDLAKRLIAGAHSAIDKFAGAATPAVGKLKEAFGDPKEKLSKLAGQAGDKKDEWLTSARETVRANPLAAVLAAVAVGALYVKATSTRAPRRSDRDD